MKSELIAVFEAPFQADIPSHPSVAKRISTYKYAKCAI